MLLQIAISCALLVITTFTHAGGMVFSLRVLRIAHAERWAARSQLTKAATVSLLVLVMFMAAIIEALIWGVTYVTVGAIPSLGEALYFSTVTFTTLGYGDIVLDEHWRLLSAFEAANGTIMFGWTTAVIVAAVRRVYFPARPVDGREATR